MAIQGILRTIEAETDAAIAEIEAEAEAEAVRILEDGATQSDAELARRASARDEEAELASARIVNGARLASERLLRRARDELYQRAHGLMLERLGRVRQRPDYPDLMARLIAEARAILPEAAILVVDPRDVDLTRAVAENLGIPLTVDPTIETLGGAELVGGDGRRVSNTLDARAHKAAAPLRSLAVEQVPELGSRR